MSLKWCYRNVIAYFGFSAVWTYRCMFARNVTYELLLMWKSVRDAPKSVEELHQIAASYIMLKNKAFYIL